MAIDGVVGQLVFQTYQKEPLPDPSGLLIHSGTTFQDLFCKFLLQQQQTSRKQLIFLRICSDNNK